MSIQSLNQETANKWTASYAGNYGIYKIKISFDDNNKLKNHNCSCPSDYYPCKHIDMILSAISKKNTINSDQKKENTSELIEKLFEGKSKQKFLVFLTNYAKYTPEFVNKLKLEFFNEKSVKSKININQIIRDGLQSAQLDDDDDYGHNHYSEEDIELEILDEWKQKADKEIEIQNFEGALEIAKAMFEEYYIWLDYSDSDYLDYISDDYEDYPFDIFSLIIINDNSFSENIFEFLKNKYNDDEFKIAQNTISQYIGEYYEDEIGQKFYIDSQNQLLLASTSDSDKKGYLENIIHFYASNNEQEKAWKLTLENIKFDRFRKIVIQKYINEKKYKDAKDLIFEKLESSESYRNNDWNEYLLQIATLENDLESVKKYSFLFIKDTFDEKKYKIYKSTFSEIEWKLEFKKIENNYNKKHGFSNSLVQLWLFENMKKEAIDYFLFQKNIEVFGNYSSHFIKDFPKETLEIYKISLNKYALKNLGRTHYEYIAKILEKIKKIKDGDALVKEMIAFYKIEYKKRPAMMEILNKNFK